MGKFKAYNMVLIDMALAFCNDKFTKTIQIILKETVGLQGRLKHDAYAYDMA